VEAGGTLGVTTGCTNGKCSIQDVINNVAHNNLSQQSNCLIDCLVFNESHVTNQLSGGFSASTTNSKGFRGLMQVGTTFIADVLFLAPATTPAQNATVQLVYNAMTNPADNIEIGSAGLQVDINRASGNVAAGLNSFDNNYSRETNDVQNCAKILNPNDPSTYQAAFAAAIQ
jgi:hypothetical protein